MPRPIMVAAVALAVAAAGCAGPTTFDRDDTTRIHHPQNEGANASTGGLHLRNAFLLAGERPGAPPAQLPLYVVLINDEGRPDRLQQVTVQQGGTARLAGPVDLPPERAVGLGRPVGMVGGVPGTASNVSMTFTFANVGDVRVNVPVKLRRGEFATLAPAPLGSATPAPAPRSPSAVPQSGTGSSSPSPTTTP
ncbi:hypothetical protein [Streptosporangium carneum]|uniref:Copper chaperone PCu(A)C n=1 Tax=Streptosporangium carneum TaxID=47481 RepID=A0A9W6I8C6_9ACTN|nr:hypothetical protein [Streptosporangium carneum]GLK12814.1 hypothetical protein GCM10017600_62240 [Streptosporangium carneum]